MLKDIGSKPANFYKEIINSIEVVAKDKNVSSSVLFGGEFDNIIERLRDNTLRVVVVGSFSSGKSTFLNALMGKDLLKHGTKETTATITEIVNSSDNEYDYLFDVTYSNGQKEVNIPITKLEEYTCTTSSIHDVAREVSRVSIKCKFIETELKICLIDTPGLNGVADKHREITIDEVKRSHLCIYLLHSRGLDKSDVEFVDLLCKYQHKFIFVQNFLDRINEIEGDTVESKLEKQKAELEQLFKNKEKGIRYQLIGVSSLMALKAKDEIFTQFDGKDLTPEYREQLFKESNFSEIVNVIKDLLSENNAYTLQKKQTIEVALFWMQELYKYILARKNGRDITEGTSESERIVLYKKIIEKLEKSKRDNEAKFADFIKNKSNSYIRVGEENISKKVSIITDEIEGQINKKSSLEDLKCYSNIELPKQLNSKFTILEDTINEYQRKAFSNLYYELILRIEELSGIKSEMTTTGIFAFSSINFDQYKAETNRDEERIIQENRRLIEEQSKLYSKKEELESIEKNMSELSSKKDVLESNKESEKRRKELEIEKLGVEPKPEVKYREVEVRKPRPKVIGWLLGDKVTYEMKEYSDDTAKAEWEKQKREIENIYDGRLQKLQKEISEIDYKLGIFDEEKKRRNLDIPTYEEKINALRAKIKADKEEYQMKVTELKKEYLKSIKNQCKEHVNRFIESAEKRIESNFKKNINNNMSLLINRVADIYDDEIKNQINEYKKKIYDNEVKFGSNDLDVLIERIQNSINLLEKAY